MFGFATSLSSWSTPVQFRSESPLTLRVGGYRNDLHMTGAPFRIWLESFEKFCRLVGTELTFIRSVARFDSGACNLRVGQCPAKPHKLGQSGATPGPATYIASRVRKQVKRSGREPGDSAGSIPVSTT